VFAPAFSPINVEAFSIEAFSIGDQADTPRALRASARSKVKAKDEVAARGCAEAPALGSPDGRPTRETHWCGVCLIGGYVWDGVMYDRYHPAYYGDSCVCRGVGSGDDSDGAVSESDSGSDGCPGGCPGCPGGACGCDCGCACP
jgi:hypothetical protein